MSHPKATSAIVAFDECHRTPLQGRGHTLHVITEALGADDLAIYINVIEPGLPGPIHHHAHSTNVYVVLRGTALVHLEGEDREVGPGHAVFIPPMTPHSAAAVGSEPLHLLEVYAPPLDLQDFIITTPAGER